MRNQKISSAINDAESVDEGFCFLARIIARQIATREIQKRNDTTVPVACEKN